MDFSFFALVRQGIRSLCQAVIHLLRHWTMPDNDAPVLNTALDLTRSRTELVLENALLVLAESTHPFGDPPLRRSSPVGPFGLTR